MMKINALCLCVLLTCVALTAGCSKEIRCALSGTVTSNGEPVPVVVVNFIPESAEGSGASCGITDGTYKMTPAAGLLAGKYKVVVNATITRDKKSGELVDIDDVTDGNVDPSAVEQIDLVPPKFGAQSEQVVEINGKDKTMVYDITMVDE